MKAALLTEIGRPLVVKDVSKPTVAADEVMIAVHACGICRTDLHIQDGLAYVPQLPHIPGHEPAGVIAEVGSQVTAFKVGQRVVPHLFVNQGDCRYTLAGQHAQATKLSGILGVTLPGGFAEFFAVPARNLLVLPDCVPFAAGGLTSCAVITAVHAYRKAHLQTGDTAVVLGIGGIGVLLVQLLAHAGVRVIAISRSPVSLELAGRAGAVATIASDRDDVARQVRAHSGQGKDGVDCVFEMVGLAQTMQLAAACVMRGGKICVIGEEAECPAIDTIQIAQRELEIIGCRNGGMQDAADAIEFLQRGVIRPVISATYPLERINEALEVVRNGGAHGRVVIEVCK